MRDSNDYDAVIIGAGIGGLVSGCYLAKQGAKVLIIERNANPGGYCNSFKVKDYFFDGCVHSIGNISPGGTFYEIIKQFNIIDELNLIRHNPSDTIISPDFKISFWNDLNRTIEDFATVFPCERKSIERFFQALINVDKVESIVFRQKTFRHVLDDYFSDNRLKLVLSLPVLGNLGVPASHICAFTAIKHYKQFMVDGGYYPKGGIQALPDALAKRFQSYGGKLFLSQTVQKINIKDKVVSSVTLKNQESFSCRFVLSDCDARQTFLQLVGADHLKSSFRKKLSTMKTSLSLFIVYGGLKKDAPQILPDRNNSWYILDYDYDKVHEKVINYDSGADKVRWFLLSPNYEKRTMMIFSGAPFKSHEFWRENRSKYMKLLFGVIEKRIPGLIDSITFKTCATPSGLTQWTLNDHGAAYGWASTVDQFMDMDFARDSIIGNLFLSGHWSTIASGVSGVAIVGDRVGRMVQARLRMK